MTPSFPNRFLAVAALLLVSLLAPGCGVGEVGSAGEGHEDLSADSDLQSTAEQALSAGDIMGRAEGFMNANITYCGGPRGGQDQTGCGEGTCRQPLGPWDAYRSDCSGFVSYVWQIPSDPSTSEYVNDRAGSRGWSTIGLDQLRAGDALVTLGHIKLFKSFASSSAALIYEEYDCYKIGHREVQHFTRSGNHLRFDGDSRTYHAIRRNGVTGGGATAPSRPPKPMRVAFGLNSGTELTRGHVVYSQDKRFELAMQADGNLVLYWRTSKGLRVLWASYTQGSGADRAVMQGDGNLVVYAGSRARWNSHTNGNPGSALALQSDGNLVVYGPGAVPLWNSRSAGH